MVGESKWVQTRKKLVTHVMNNEVTIEQLWGDRDLGMNTLLAMRDEIRYLREKLAEWKEKP